MEEKRLSLRFRMDREQDKRAWELLQRISAEENTSRNASIIRLICNSADGEAGRSLDEVAEDIAELVAVKVAAKLKTSEDMTTAAKVADDKVFVSQQPQADEPDFVGEEALNFLDSF